MLMVRGREVLRSLAASRQGIGARLLVSVLLFSGALTLILTAIQLYLDYRRDVSAIAWRVDEVSLSYRDSLAEGLWNVDERQLKLQLSGILRLPDIRWVEVRETGTTRNPLIIRLGETPTSSARIWEYPLVHNERGRDTIIGTLRVEATLAGVYARLVDTALTILVSHAAKTFLVSFFILFVFDYLVTRHLSAIAADIGSYRINDRPLELRLRRRPPRHEDELDGVVTAFNALSSKLHIAYRDLAEREAKIRRLVDSNIIGILVFGMEGQIVEANDAFLRMVGYDREDLVSGRVRWKDMTPSEWRHLDVLAVAAMKSTGSVRGFEKEYFRKDGSRVPVLVGGAASEENGTQGVAFVIDLTERKAAEADRARLGERLRQAEKMEAVGRFAGGIAHDFNNVLSGIVAYGETLVDETAAASPLRRYAQNVVTAANRGRALVEQILVYSRSQRGMRTPVDLAGVVAETLELVRAALPPGVRLEVSFPEARLVVTGDGTQLHQVVMNLCSNAIQAMGAGGSLRVALEAEQIAAERALSHGTLRPGRHARLSVGDQGCGMDAATLTRIFEPFFTTKAIGRGTGLGLSILYAIVADWGGVIDVESVVKKGSTFAIYLPLAGIVDAGA